MQMHDDVSHYLEQTHSQPNPLLLELEQHGRYEEVPAVSRALGRFLSVLVHAMQANRVLEVGTAYGYATMWMGLALPPAGKIWTLDPNIERTEMARSYFDRAGISDRIEVINQPAQVVLPSFPQHNFDIVFIDGDKKEYREYLDHALPMLKLSGLIVAHNLFLGGRVFAKPNADDDAAVKAIRHFNDAFLSHPDLDASILPLAGGTGIGSRVR
ncbi:MAG: O-methyltransferase [Candidatus Eremiobacteraeota bacterium]|nr:O-methyltransferase [Candidatus Eremiobacteraeota bacterium]